MQDISRAIQAGINLLDGRDPLPIPPSDIESLAELKSLLKAIRLGHLRIASPDKIKEDKPQNIEGEN